MEPLLAFLKDMLTSQPMMQVFVGAGTFMLIAYMILRATKDKNALPAVAAPNISDVPQPFLQGPRETVDLMREIRDQARRITEDISRIAECTRTTKEEAIKQTALLAAIEREQALENRVHDRDRP
jgi:hypothetical protein